LFCVGFVVVVVGREDEINMAQQEIQNKRGRGKKKKKKKGGRWGTWDREKIPKKKTT